MKLHLSSGTGKDLANKIGLVYQFNIAPKKLGFNEEIYVVDLKKGELAKDDGLLHTTCGSPNYVAPEILLNRGYDGATSDTWSCGVILYLILMGYLPFDDRNLAVLYQKIFKGDAHIPKWLSPGAAKLVWRILDPNPKTRITMAEIKEDKWFQQGYTPANADEDEKDILIGDEALSIQEDVLCVGLWCLDEYWYYSLFTLFMLFMFESTMAKSRLKTLSELRRVRVDSQTLMV